MQDFGELDFIFEAYRRYTDGFLPKSGGSMEQPATLMQFIDIVIREQQIKEERIARAS